MQYSSQSFHVVPTLGPSQPVWIETTCKSLYVTIKIKQTILHIENACKSLFETIEGTETILCIKSGTIIRRRPCVNPLIR